ncbi:hypothetical protein [Botrimarina hoheduenensis]|uniref:Uncharacterized protein n=1 Tax=Botrimarina hoheduenensis TaxID=2528000 RepID=A0A5C5VRN2_9BACT|nr:hypothetical protein [Botrimarina hoheduenensis]TWT40850.1 hypothetical protein Pla111_32680 [Botrimarina hoheduenensis]
MPRQCSVSSGSCFAAFRDAELDEHERYVAVLLGIAARELGVQEGLIAVCDLSMASVEFGEKTLENTSAALTELLAEVSRFLLSTLARGVPE